MNVWVESFPSYRISWLLVMFLPQAQASFHTALTHEQTKAELSKDDSLCSLFCLSCGSFKLLETISAAFSSFWLSALFYWEQLYDRATNWWDILISDRKAIQASWQLLICLFRSNEVHGLHLADALEGNKWSPREGTYHIPWSKPASPPGIRLQMIFFQTIFTQPHTSSVR